MSLPQVQSAKQARSSTFALQPRRLGQAVSDILPQPIHRVRSPLGWRDPELGGVVGHDIDWLAVVRGPRERGPGALVCCPGFAHAQASGKSSPFIGSAPGGGGPDATATSPQIRPAQPLLGQDLFPVLNPEHRPISNAEAEKVYLAACAVVEREFGCAAPLRPRLTRVLGANADQLLYPGPEIRLTKWDKFLFAQGVIALAFDDLLVRERVRLSHLAVSRSEATVDVGLEAHTGSAGTTRRLTAPVTGRVWFAMLRGCLAPS
jgi:hypothetical protein